MIFLVLSVWTFLRALFGGAAAAGILSLVPFWRPPVLARPFWNRVSGDGSEFDILKTWLSILAAALGVASSVCLYRGSKATPVSTQWYKGTT
jgi:hypothetical protein